jgi:hypothetical protein
MNPELGPRALAVLGDPLPQRWPFCLGTAQPKTGVPVSAITAISSS